MKPGNRPTRYNWFALTPTVFILDANYETMSTEVFGAHFLLQFRSWTNQPVGSLPADDETLARIARVSPERWGEIKDQVLTGWKRRRNRVHSEFLTSEFKRCEDEYKAKVEGNEKRWKNARNSNDLQTSPQRDHEVTDTERNGRNGTEGKEGRDVDGTEGRAGEVTSVRGEAPAMEGQPAAVTEKRPFDFPKTVRPSSSCGLPLSNVVLSAPIVSSILFRAMTTINGGNKPEKHPDQGIILQVIEAAGSARIEDLEEELMRIAEAQEGQGVRSWPWWVTVTKAVFEEKRQLRRNRYQPPGPIY